jgi:hypothetical protein
MELRQAISEVIGLGHTEKEIAAMVAAESGQTCSQATINRIKTGVISDPAFSLGAALLRVRERLMVGQSQ